MVKIIEYIKNKTYIQDTKMGRRWRVPERGEKEKQRKERGEEKNGRKQGGQKPSGLSTKKKQWASLFVNCHL